MNKSFEDNVIYITTDQPTSIKTMFNVLKTQMDECNLKITQDKIEILNTGSHNATIIHAELYSKSFTQYKCLEPVLVGVSLANINNILKCVENKCNILTLFVEKCNAMNNVPRLGICIENKSKNQIIKNYLDIINSDNDEEEYDIPELKYNNIIKLPSTNLQSIINNIKSTGSKTVRIQYNNGILKFYTKGEASTQEVTQSTVKTEDIDTKKTDIIQIYIMVNKLVKLTKCLTMSTFVDISMHNDIPLCLQFEIGTLGFMKFAIMTCNKPTEWD